MQLLARATFYTCPTGYGPGYAWSPSSVTVLVGDTVMWRWTAPAFQRVGYRVFSVSSPAGTTYEGGPFTSGDAKTETGRHSLTVLQKRSFLIISTTP